MEKDERNTLYHCPLHVCDHEGFQSQRGCRKYVSTKHSWIFYFDEKPDLSSFKDTLQVPVNKLPLTTIDDCTSSQTARAFPAVSIFGQIGQEFTQWLTGSGSGCKKERAAQQIVRRSFKFLKFCCEDEEELSWEIVDFSLCSTSLLFKFVDHLQDKCMLGHGRRLGYIDAISELIDFRKMTGTSDTVLRHLTTTELYLKGARKNDEIAVDTRFGHRNVGGEGLLDNNGGDARSCDLSRAALREHCENLQNESWPS